MRGKGERRVSRARSLRRALAPAEAKLWANLRNRQLDGFKFARQEPIGAYYADFVCRDRKLIVEVDGGQHAESAADRLRDDNLAALGYRVVRIWNNEVIENIDGVLQYLLSDCSDSPSPRPSPRKRGEGKILRRQKEGNRLPRFVLAGLDPAIHAFGRPKQRRGCADQVRARRLQVVSSESKPSYPCRGNFPGQPCGKRGEGLGCAPRARHLYNALLADA
jgi:very-short-patch-repair endonuclease